MNYRAFSLSVLVFLAACNDSDTQGKTSAVKPPLVGEGTFAAAAPPVQPNVTADEPLVDNTLYPVGQDDSVALADVTEKSSIMHHAMKIKGETVKYTTRAGHLIAYAHTRKDGVVTKDPQAALYYTSYTWDTLPKEKRAVTFFWNGGPGSSSQWLHLGSWAPKRIVTGAPHIPAEYQSSPQPTMPMIDNLETLLDKSDLVFVDPVGTGYSSAIAPHKNADFWGMDADAKVVRDFITSYTNTYNRQSSPKYLHGESYGGIRTPIVARLLLEDGTSNFADDPTGKPPVVLTGMVLQSPITDYNSNCTDSPQAIGLASCQGMLPTYAAVADSYKMAKARGKLSFERFMGLARGFADLDYASVFRDRFMKAAALSIKDPFDKSLMDDYLKQGPKTGADYRKKPDSEKVASQALREQLLLTVNNSDYFAGKSANSFYAPQVVQACALIFEKYNTYAAYAASLGNNSAQIYTNLLSNLPSPKNPYSLTAEEKKLVPTTFTPASIGDLFRQVTAEMVKAGGLKATAYTIQQFIINRFWKDGSTIHELCSSKWTEFVFSDPGKKYLENLYNFTGVGYPENFTGSKSLSNWTRYPNMRPEIFASILKPGYNFNMYDGRMSVSDSTYNPSNFDKLASNTAMKNLIANHAGYKGKSDYTGLNEHIILSWDWTIDPNVTFSANRVRTSIPDIIESLVLKPDLRVLAIHGYTDLRTPFHQTELDMENAGLGERFPVKTYAGGHMTYHDETSRAPMKALLDDFYDGKIGGAVPADSTSAAAMTLN